MEIDLKEELRIEAYKNKMNIDIEDINNFEKRNKVYTTQWRTIYEVIEPAFFKKSDTFPDYFIKIVRIMQMKLIIYHLR